MHRVTKLLLLVVAALIGGQLVGRSLRHAEPPPAGAGAPPLALPDLRGRTVDLATLRGKVVAVNFWASWCGPCRAEMPALSRVWSEHQGRCFELLGVAEESAREDVARVAASLPYPVLLDERAEALRPWAVEGYPHTSIIDADGRVRHVFNGGISKEELEDAIRPLLPATCPAS
jgi:cytochrome c biogenesis protein CcmG/thiol:disulfide interchange protein DsbE